MSEQNVEAVKRAREAINRRDAEALLEELDPEVEWHPGVLMPSEGEMVAALQEVFSTYSESPVF